MLHTFVIAMTALGAAFCYSVSNVIAQRKASAAPLEQSMKVSLLWTLAHDPVWWLGIAVDLGGFGLQAVALDGGSLAFVQPMLVTSLLFSLLLGAATGAGKVSPRELRWAGVLMVSLAGFLVIAAPSAGVDQRPLRAWMVPLIFVAGVVGACFLLAKTAQPRSRSALLAAAAGTSFGVSSTLIKTFSHLIAVDGVLALFRHWELYAMAGVLTLGFLSAQSAFQAGDLRAALPPLLTAEPIIATVLGVGLMHEQFQAHGPLSKAALAVCVVLMLWSVILLAQATSDLGERTLAAGGPQPNLSGE